MKAVILARVSTKEQMEEGQSIPAQIRRLTEYAERKGYKESDIEAFQIAESSTKNARRKKFQKIIDIIKSSKQKVSLIVDTVDRLQRSFRESVTLDDFRKEGKLELHFLRENLILDAKSNSADLMRWDMYVMFARNYVLQLSDNVKRSNEEKRLKGMWNSPAPLGYKNARSERNEGIIVPDEKTAGAIIKIFDWYSQGNCSVQTIADEIYSAGFRGKYGNKISHSTVHLILKNQLYFGYLKDKDGKFIKGIHEPLVSYEIWKKCNERLQNFHKATTKYAGIPSVFRSLLTCANCGCRITVERKTKFKKTFVLYSCTNSKQVCKRKCINENKLLAQVESVLKDLIIDEGLLKKCMKKNCLSIKKDKTNFFKNWKPIKKHY